MLYRFVRHFCRQVFSNTTRLRFRASGPKPQGGYILARSHASHFDPICLSALMPAQPGRLNCANGLRAPVGVFPIDEAVRFRCAAYIIARSRTFGAPAAAWPRIMPRRPQFALSEPVSRRAKPLALLPRLRPTRSVIGPRLPRQYKAHAKILPEHAKHCR